MTWGTDPIGYVAWAEIPDAANPTPIAAAYDAITGRVFLYEFTAFKRGGGGSWDSPWGSDAWGAAPDSVVAAGNQTFRYSDVGYISLPSDSIANTLFEGAISDSFRVSRAAPATPEQARRVNFDLGRFSLLNGDGALDDVVRNYSVDGRQVRILFGLGTYSYDQFTAVFTGRMKEWDNDLKTVSFVVRDEGYRLEKPMQTDIYGGTGLYDGDANLAGKPRPMTFGQAPYVPAPLINATSLIYQVHSRAIQSIDAVYDRGAAVTAGADYASYAALAAATVAGGTYATCLAFGLFRLGSSPTGLVTADVKGDNVGGYVDTTGRIGKRIINDFGTVSDTDLDLASYDSFETDLPGTIGWWQGTDAINVDDALDRIYGHCAGWWGAKSDGKFQVGRLAAPTADKFVMTLDSSDDFDLTPIEPLSGTFPPRYKQQVGYQKLWATAQSTDLAGAVTAARRQFLAQEYRLATSTDPSVLVNFLLATSPDPLVSLFQNLSDAQTLADSLLALHKEARQTVVVSMGMKGIGARLSATVLVTHPRLNKGAATPMLVLGINMVAAKRRIELTLWG